MLPSPEHKRKGTNAVHSQESIYKHLSDTMVKLFEIDADDIRPDALLVEDLDVDSIDAVDLAVELQELTGSKIQPDDFKEIRTVQDIVDAVLKLANAETT